MTARRPCPDCGEPVIGSKKQPMNATHNPRGLYHQTTCTARMEPLAAAGCRFCEQSPCLCQEVRR